MALDQRQQAFIFGGAIPIIGAALYWYLLFSPKQLELTTKSLQIDTLEMRTDSLKKLSVRGGNTDSLNAEAERYRRQLDAMRHLVPAENELPGLLDNITDAAQRADLEITGLAPTKDPVRPGDQFDIYRYTLSVVGPYHRVGAFLSNIGSMERIVVPMNVKVELWKGASTVRGRKPPRNEVFVQASCELQTYVAKTSVPARTSEPAKPGGAGRSGQ